MNAWNIPPRQTRVLNRLQVLGDRPPQALLLEGGDDAEREALARFWAARLNCKSGAAAPCLQCTVCMQIAEGTFRDLLLVDGRLESIKMEMIREVPALVGEPPRGDGYRVITLLEAQNLVPEAANKLLKSMEEPRPGNVFVLTVPQREQLLPTIVSRSFCLTLAWPQTMGEEEYGVPPDAMPDPTLSDDPAALEWAEALVAFLATGRGWFGRTSGAGKLDAFAAKRVITACRRLLGLARLGRPGGAAAQLASALPPAGLTRLATALEEAEDALELKANPTLVLDWLAASARTWTRG